MMKFDSNSTTDDVLQNIDLSGKTIIVTGASGGIGEETARAFAARGADVTIAARSEEKLLAAQTRIQESTGVQVKVGFLELDKPESVRHFANQWLAEHDKLDILVNNAGIMTCPLTYTKEGWELQFATNHLGHFLLSNLMLDALKAGAPSRVVSLSSAGHNVASVDFQDVNYKQKEYSEVAAYGQSKTANIWFANEFDRRFRSYGIRAFSVHPGGIQTDLGRHLTPDVLDELLEVINTRSTTGEGGKTISQGAATSCYAATSPQLSNMGGVYLLDCQIAKEGNDILKNHSPWAYDTEGAQKLWSLSNELLKTEF